MLCENLFLSRSSVGFGFTSMALLILCYHREYISKVQLTLKALKAYSTGQWLVQPCRDGYNTILCMQYRGNIPLKIFLEIPKRSLRISWKLWRNVSSLLVLESVNCMDISTTIARLHRVHCPFVYYFLLWSLVHDIMWS